MGYVILGVGAAGITAAKTIRKAEKEAEITMISTDRQVHSRCMLHKYLSHERTDEKLSFVPEDFFETNRIHWIKGKTVTGLDTNVNNLTPFFHPNHNILWLGYFCICKLSVFRTDFSLPFLYFSIKNFLFNILDFLLVFRHIYY